MTDNFKKKFNDISPNMCIMPWIGLSTSTGGGIHPCCWMESLNYEKYRGSAKDYKKSEYLKNLKNQFLNGKWPKECAKCEKQEAMGNNSKRIRENHLWLQKNKDWDSLPEDFSYIELRLSNVCNLGCISCNSKSSSFLKKEIDKNGSEQYPDFHKSIYNTYIDADLLNPYPDDDIEEIFNMIGSNSRVYISGGEPSLVKKSIEQLTKLKDKGYNKTINLQFNSNFQTLNKEWFDILKDFQGEMWPSIDGVGKVAEYVRYPSDWSKVSQNLKFFIEQCPHWKVRVCPTVSILNIFNLKELYEYVYNDIYENASDNIRLTLNNRVYSPNWLDIRNLPKKLKDIANNKLDHIETKYFKYEIKFNATFNYIDEVRKHLNYKPEIDFSETIKNLEKLDKIRNNSWKDVLTTIYNNWN